MLGILGNSGNNFLIFSKEKVEPGPEAEDTSCAVSDPELEGEVKERLPRVLWCSRYVGSSRLCLRCLSFIVFSASNLQNLW